jgi:TonB-dependent receptor
VSFGRKLGVSVTGGYQEVGDGLQTIRTTFAGNWDYASPTVGRQVLYADQEYHLNKRVAFQTKFDYRLSKESSVSFTVGWTRFVNVMDQNRPQYTDNLTFDAANSTTDFWVFSRSSYRSGRDIRYTPNDTWNFQLNGKTAIGEVKLAWALTYSDSFRPLDRMSATARSNNLYSFTYDRRTSKEFPTLTFGGAVPPPGDPFTNMLSIAVTGTHEDASDKIASAKLDATRDFAQWRISGEAQDRFSRSPAGSRPRCRLHHRHARRRRLQPVSRHGPARLARRPVPGDADHRHEGGVPGHRFQLPALRAARAACRTVRVQRGGAASHDCESQHLGDQLPAERLSDAETIPAAYLQGEVKLAKNLQMTAGVRVEQTKATITSRFENTRAATPEERFGAFRTVESDYVDWFPNLQFRYEPIPHFTVRANYSTTIGRPRISDLVGRFSINDLGQTVSFSNPSLKPQISSNYDVSLEYYFKPVGIVSIGAFRKDIKNYVTATSFRITGNEFGLDLDEYVGLDRQQPHQLGQWRGEGHGVQLLAATEFPSGRSERAWRHGKLDRAHQRRRLQRRGWRTAV